LCAGGAWEEQEGGDGEMADVHTGQNAGEARMDSSAPRWRLAAEYCRRFPATSCRGGRVRCIDFRRVSLRGRHQPVAEIVPDTQPIASADFKFILSLQVDGVGFSIALPRVRRLCHVKSV
jgi:hypothetical protein